ncbi:diaminopropionate ammonia-lyase [Maritalea myrionectae]|uniref:Diaminopropionate ammonia-lyase n=1 Tax=Maritalea myrionectae TaxID=454601 RepID=A0A2R4MFG9_9HYPH|nr:pyridoxal-phosphate dependent enzyme [Maritalea myrionectae]AVX04750.1 diaminopropionate ammonia-lyase [Maritalea myrionectae]
MDILKVARPALVSDLSDVPVPSIDAPRAQALVERCPRHAETPLTELTSLAADANIAQLWVKDERDRMGLGSFKALGAAYVIACDKEQGAYSGRTYVAASAGNHGLSVAAGAQAFGAASVIYLADSVPESFAARLREHGAEVRRAGATYEDSMAAAHRAAEENGWALLSDSSWPGYFERPHRLMEGYLVLMAEAIRQMPTPPTHFFLQAGVGGLAGACAALARQAWGDQPTIIVVEPDAAPALFGSIQNGAPVESSGPVSAMGRLDCKMPSLIALKGLARDADAYTLISEQEGEAGAEAMRAAGMATTPSGAAGIAALLSMSDAQKAELGLDSNSVVLTVLSEGPES